MTTENNLYIELIKKCILGYIYKDPALASFAKSNGPSFSSSAFDTEVRGSGLDWPSQAHSMIGLKRMENIQNCVESVLENSIGGDMVETGVWRGGACIFMRALLKANNIQDKAVWVCDSFEGLPPANKEKYPLDDGFEFSKFNDQLAISLEEVKDNFEKYGLLDDQVKFLKGWFSETLPTAPIEKISILRLDGDMYESTMDALVNLYSKLSVGGYCIIDDWSILTCAKAVKDFRAEHNIEDNIISIDKSSAYWKKG